MNKKTSSHLSKKIVFGTLIEKSLTNIEREIIMVYNNFF